MDFNKNQPIYIQIADMVCEKILLKTWKENERIPSVREMALSIQVNPNTVMRTYAFLQEEGIINNQRGIGYFVEENGCRAARAFVAKQIFENDFHNLFRKMKIAEVSFEVLQDHYAKFITNLGEGNEED